MESKFVGAFTALVTPFHNGKVDVDALRKLVKFQIDNGIDGIMPCGTTGESPVLSFEEYKLVVSTVVEEAAGKTTVIAGAGSNSTEHAIELAKFAKAAGADATLQVNPYYNKPTQEGLYRHFAEIAKHVDMPHILYNIQGRTGVNINTDTMVRLAKIPNIVGVKEASGSIAQMMEVINECPDNFIVLSGDDNMTMPLMAMGGKGVISVLSNVMPAEVSSMVRHALTGNMATAVDEHYKLMPWFKAIFIETNPIPIKAMLAMMGMMHEEYRLPLCELTPANREKILKLMKESGLLHKSLA